MEKRPGEGPRVALFATCINDMMFPDTPKAVVSLLERLGCTVHFPREQTCCGQMFTNSGYFDEALPTVETYLDAFEDADYIVGPSGSCVGAVRHQHPMLARHFDREDLAQRSEEVIKRTYDLSEFIVDVLGLSDVGAYFPHKVTYHPTCHSVRVAHVGDRPMKLLQAVEGIEVVPLVDSDQCCGFGGTFSVKNPDVSVAMATDKATRVAETGAEFLVAGDNACLMNINGVLRRQGAATRPIHLAEILASTRQEHLGGVA